MRRLSEAIAALPATTDRSRRPAALAMATSGEALVSVAAFPQHIEDIVAVVKSAEDSIVIHTDAIDYGGFRDFKLHRALLDAIIEQGIAGKRVHVLIWHDHQPMSWANRFRLPQARAGSEFQLCIRDFLVALKTRTTLTTTEEYRIVEDRLAKKADWVSNEGDIKALLKLQLKLHDLELAELHAAGVSPRGSNKDADVSSINSEKDREAPTQFYWIVDGSRGIIVQPALGTDALAMYTGNKHYLHALLTNFYSIYDRAV